MDRIGFRPRQETRDETSENERIQSGTDSRTSLPRANVRRKFGPEIGSWSSGGIVVESENEDGGSYRQYPSRRQT